MGQAESSTNTPVQGDNPELNIGGAPNSSNGVQNAYNEMGNAAANTPNRNAQTFVVSNNGKMVLNEYGQPTPVYDPNFNRGGKSIYESGAVALNSNAGNVFGNGSARFPTEYDPANAGFAANYGPPVHNESLADVRGEVNREKRHGLEFQCAVESQR